MYDKLGLPAFFNLDSTPKQDENLSKIKTSETLCHSSMDKTCLSGIVGIPKQVEKNAGRKNKTVKRKRGNKKSQKNI